MKNTINILKLLIIYIIIIFNTVFAQIEHTLKPQYADVLVETKEWQCTPDMKNQGAQIMGFNCISIFLDTKVHIFVDIYQIDTYESFYLYSKFTSPRAQNYNREREYYITHKPTGINFDSIDDKALNGLRNMIDQKAVIIKIADIPNAITEKSHNNFDIVGTVYLDGLDVGQELIKQGLAWASPPKWNSNDQYNQAQKYAQENQVGFWKDGNTVSPWELREFISKAKQEMREKQKKKDKIIEKIILGILLIGSLVGFWGSFKIANRIPSGASIFLIIIPYMALGGNLFVVSLGVFYPDFMWAVWGVMITIPIAAISFLIGVVILLIGKK